MHIKTDGEILCIQVLLHLPDISLLYAFRLNKHINLFRCHVSSCDQRVKYKNLERSQAYVCVRIKYTFFYLFVLNVFFKYIWLYNPLHM